MLHLWTHRHKTFTIDVSRRSNTRVRPRCSDTTTRPELTLGALRAVRVDDRLVVLSGLIDAEHPPALRVGR